jgi:hypothetical protein
LIKFTLLAEHEGIGLNTDILETGLINILRYLQFYFLLVKTFRIIIRRAKTTIVKGVQDAEDRLNEEKSV